MLRPIVLLSLAFSASLGQTPVPQSPSGTPRPVTGAAKTPVTKAISFTEFEFQQTSLLHAGPGLFRLAGEPSRGTQYVVEAYVHGEEAIATARFEAVDENGSSIQPIAMARTGAPGKSRYRGLMTTPGQPFRIALIGEATDGQPFRRVARRLFKPVDQPPAPRRLSGLSREEAALVQRMMDEATPLLVGEVAALLAASPSGRITMPRAHVTNVSYVPLVSPGGRPTGVRITYDVEFPQRGEYDPRLSLVPEYGEQVRGGPPDFHVLHSSLDPWPREVFAPFDRIVLGDGRPSPLAHGANFVYDAGTVYHFSVDMVPNFIFTTRDRASVCISDQRFSLARDSAAALAQMLATDRPMTYKVGIGGTFEGRIDNLAGEGTFYQSFVADGTQPCPPPRY